MSENVSPFTVFGIRHHGPGSARSLLEALGSLKPDAVLVEGPPEASDLLSWVANKDLHPPVALLVYEPDRPKRAAYYPFAVFSPEWQAVRYALAHILLVRFMDLPQAHQLAVLTLEDEQESQPPSDTVTNLPIHETGRSGEDQTNSLYRDPLAWVAEAAGYSDGERWWEHQVEQRRDSRDLFAAILELMAGLRAEVDQQPFEGGQPVRALLLPLEAHREAHMRQTMRATLREGFQRIAVVCGAWHAPVLQDLDNYSAREDEMILKGLPKVKVSATWVPWTYGRLSWESGYGAGIESPGWYHHLWMAGQEGLTSSEVSVRWLSQVAHLFRQEDLDASSAHTIEAVRLAEALAALRGRPLPGLPELNEAVQAVFCLGEEMPLRLIHERMIVGERLGQVPREMPVVPLQSDLERQQKRLRLPPEAGQRDLDLDLRKPNDLERSYLLHRLNLLGIPWGVELAVRGKKGTFHEFWRLQWKPEFAVALIETSIWGNTVKDAASAFAVHTGHQAVDLPALTGLLGRVLLADLPEAASRLMNRLENAVALSSDVGQLMDALPPLANVLRYGNVRQTDAGMLSRMVGGLLARICIGLPPTSASLNDEAAGQMFERLVKVNDTLILLQEDEYWQSWQQTLTQLVDQAGLHGLLAGRICRILLDRKLLVVEEAARRMSLALSTANPPAHAAAWLEGFLKGSGSLLLHDTQLWQLLDGWVTFLPAEIFNQVLPLLRRTFASFAKPERRQMGERARRGAESQMVIDDSIDFHLEQAEAVLPLLVELLGLEED